MFSADLFERYITPLIGQNNHFVCRVIVTMRQQFADTDPRRIPRNSSRTATHRGANSVLVETSGNPATDIPARLRSLPLARREFQSKLLSADIAASGYIHSYPAHGCSNSNQLLPSLVRFGDALFLITKIYSLTDKVKFL